jgi:hypothetical protein
VGLFLHTSIPFIWHMLSAFLRNVAPACTPWLRGVVSPRRQPTLPVLRLPRLVLLQPQRRDDWPSEKDAKLAQKLGQLQIFAIAVLPQQRMGQLASFWANLTPFSRQFIGRVLKVKAPPRDSDPQEHLLGPRNIYYGKYFLGIGNIPGGQNRACR